MGYLNHHVTWFTNCYKLTRAKSNNRVIKKVPPTILMMKYLENLVNSRSIGSILDLFRVKYHNGTTFEKLV